MKVNGSKILAKDINYWLKQKSKRNFKRNFSKQDIINEYKPVLKNLSTKIALGFKSINE